MSLGAASRFEPCSNGGMLALDRIWPALAIGIAAALHAGSAGAADNLVPGSAALDPPTVVTLGVQLLVSGDDNHDAKVTVRYRPSGTSTWKDGLPLYRVRPESVTGLSVPEQFAGSLFDLAPGTAYEIELHATDTDGAVDQTIPLAGTTRAVPADPKNPKPKMVTDAASLQAALGAAQPGDVITLADGTYAGSFALDASGTADDPIVLRGQTADGVVLDGGGCDCNVLEIYGSFVHVERLTIRNATRALRFQGDAAESNVVRRVHVQQTRLGFGSKQNQKDFYICDNDLEGLLSWPSVYADDGGAHANDDGIHVEGSGHVVCHNRIVGYGDAMKTEQAGARAIDFYGNEVLSAYDNGLELDGSAGNVRAFRNRFTNTYATISFQPIFGGPAYAFRNVIVNVANEQMKFHGLGTVPPEEPSGILVMHNTFVSARKALDLQTSATSHHFLLENNLFIGPAAPDEGKTVDWTGPIDDGTFDYNGYFPEGIFAFNTGGSYQKFPSFAALQAAGFENNGRLVGADTFASGLTAPASYTTTSSPEDVALAPASAAVDHGVVLSGINDGFIGAAPDLGALELGCPLPAYGVRAEGVDESNEPLGCGSPGTGGSAGAGGAGSSTGGTGQGAAATTGAGSPSGAGGGANGDDASDDGGCGCRTPRTRAHAPWVWLGLAGLLAASRRRRSFKTAGVVGADPSRAAAWRAAGRG